jgi:hypothetical protein
MKMRKIITRKTWEDFQKTGLLWFINRLLHLFGWVIVFQQNKEKKVIDVYPARTTYRGFSPSSEREGFEDVTKYIKENINDIQKDLNV